jgi:hypothetical protein
MNPLSQKKIVILGMMAKTPVAGNIWLVLHYLIGFKRLGYDAYYVEAHASTPSMLMDSEGTGKGSAEAADLIANVMRRFDLNDRWAFHALHDDGQCYGLSESQLQQLYADADLIINLHGATLPLPEHSANGRLVYLETDPVALEVELYHQDAAAQNFLSSHAAFLTWGENYGNPDCEVPLPAGVAFSKTRAPVICDFWKNGHATGGNTFTTIGNWRQAWRDLTFRGEVYRWSKHHEYLKIIDLPSRIDQEFELALGSYHREDEKLLERHGWKIRPAMSFSLDLDAYCQYIRSSRGEFTVAKDQNVRLRSGWFSERSAQYLAAGRPVITQETGFSNVLPTGRGLFAFSTMEDILIAVDSINSDYEGHCRAAAELAHEYFNYDVVLKRLLQDVGL